MSIVAKITGQFLGISNGPELSPYTEVTITPAGSGFAGPIVLMTLSPSILQSWQVGSTVTMYIAVAPADQAAIESAVTVVGIDSQT